MKLSKLCLLFWGMLAVLAVSACAGPAVTATATHAASALPVTVTPLATDTVLVPTPVPTVSGHAVSPVFDTDANGRDAVSPLPMPSADYAAPCVREISPRHRLHTTWEM